MSSTPLRDTQYATELAHASMPFSDSSEGRLERLRFKEGQAKGAEGYRFSWWKEGRMIPRPLDVTEDEFVSLFEKAVQEGVFTDDVLAELRKILQ